MFHCSNKHFFKKTLLKFNLIIFQMGNQTGPWSQSWLVAELRRDPGSPKHYRIAHGVPRGATEGAAAETKCHMGQASVS